MIFAVFDPPMLTVYLHC